MAEGLRNNSNKDNIDKTNNKETQELSKQQTNRSLLSSKSLRSNTHSVPKQSGVQNSNNSNNNNNNNTGTKRTVLKSIRNLFVKASVNLSIAAAKLKSFAEDALSSDEIVNELFLVTSSSSVDSSLLEQQEEAAAIGGEEETTNNNNIINNNQATGITGGSEAAELSENKVGAAGSDMTTNSSNEVPSNGVNGTNGNGNGNVTASQSLPTFQDFDAVQEAKLLHQEEQESEQTNENSDLFANGHKIWEKRRQVWLNSTSEERTKAKQRSLENSLIGVSKDNYPIIYNSLIEKQKTLKKPMNLKDALKIINAGWIASKKWERAASGMP